MRDTDIGKPVFQMFVLWQFDRVGIIAQRTPVHGGRAIPIFGPALRHRLDKAIEQTGIADEYFVGKQTHAGGWN